MGLAEVLGLVVGVVAFALTPVVSELLLVLLVSHVPVVHVSRFCGFWVEVFCDES